MLCGTEGVGKSALGYCMSVALSSGLPVLGRQTTPARVLYVDEENSSRDIAAYLYRAWRGLSAPPIDAVERNLCIMKGSLNEAGDQWAKVLTHAAAVHRPDLIIIDTVTPSCRILDENSNGEAAIAARKLRLAQEAAGPDCTMLIYKHLRIDHKSGRMDVRGAKLWKGTVDAVAFHTRLRGRPRADGMYRTAIRPEKIRAFGLHTKIIIDPALVNDGLVLHSTDAPISDDDLP